MRSVRSTYYQRTSLIVWLLLAFPARAAESVWICHDFGCRNETRVVLDDAEWESVRELFDASDAAEERQQIGNALGYMEFLAGRHSPIHRDRGGNLPPGAERLAGLPPGQTDCIDESVNALRFMEMFRDAGLLKFHRIVGRAYRRSLITQHWAVEVEDVANGRRFVYDTWFEDNGEPPIMVTSPRWYNLWLAGSGLNLPPGRRSTLSMKNERPER